jgi:hypothetical protein
MCAKWQQQQQPLLLWIALACSLQAATVAALPFRVYEPCAADAGGVGFCRTEPSSKQQDRRGSVLPAAVTKPVPKQLAVDMRFPCTEPQSCKLVRAFLMLLRFQLTKKTCTAMLVGKAVSSSLHVVVHFFHASQCLLRSCLQALSPQ